MPMLTATMLALASLAVAAGGGTAAGVAQSKAADQQQQAQDTSLNKAITDKTLNDQATAAANKKVPDVAAILSRAAQDANGGASSTMLTGSSGVNTGGLTLGKTSLLGG